MKSPFADESERVNSDQIHDFTFLAQKYLVVTYEQENLYIKSCFDRKHVLQVCYGILL